MAPPAKRQKRLVVLSSSDAEDATTAFAGAPEDPEHGSNQTLSLPSRTRATQKRTKSIEPGQLPVSPRKQAPRSKRARNPPKDRSINTFFTAATGTQTSTNQLDGWSIEDLEDAIQDDSLIEEELNGNSQKTITGAAHDEHAQERHRDAVSTEPRRPRRPAGLQKFRSEDSTTKFPTEASIPSQRLTKEDSRPWVDRYAPLTLGEIAVHSKKVEDVRRWILDTFAGRSQKKVLVLKGPSGIGKSTTVSLLSKDLDFDVLEWHNPTAGDPQSTGYASVLLQFQDFIGRGAKYDSLDLRSSTDSVGGGSAKAAPASTSPFRNKLILLEEYPNTFTGSSNSVQSLRMIIQQFLSSDPPPFQRGLAGGAGPTKPVIPLVMVISETVLTASTSSESFTAHRLLGPDILSHPAVSVIEFNPIARTLLAKALDLVIQKDARCTGRRNMPGPSVMEKLGEVGDIRSAIGSLQMLCLRGDSASNWSQRVALSKPKRNARSGVPMTTTEKESLEVITQREASLGMFHAVGKVVYNKRDEETPTDVDPSSLPQPPDHLSYHARPKRSPLVVDELMDQMGTDVRTFICALHENYIPSCSASPTTSSMDIINGCIDALSDCDVLDMTYDGASGYGNRRSGLARAGFSGTSRDSLRQDEISFQTAVRGMLFALPSPVRRQLPSSSRQQGRTKIPGRNGAGDAFKMFYPISLKLWRRREELEGLLEVCMRHLGQDALASSPDSISSAGPTGTVESWKRKAPTSSIQAVDRDPSCNDTAAVSMSNRGGSARSETILERLPYQTKILKGKVKMMPSLLRHMEDLTVFSGLDVQMDGDSDDEDEPAAGNSRPSAKEASQRTLGVSRTAGLNFGAQGTQNLGQFMVTGEDSFHAPDHEQKLVLSDDDIED